MSVEVCKNMEKQFIRGDIVRNNHAGDGSRYKYLVYMKKGTIRQGRYSHKSYDCISYDGKVIQLFRDNSDLEKVGHMNELDAFVSALKMLKDR